MPAVDFAANRKRAEDEGLISGGEFYKYQNGDNRLRLLSECLPHPSEFNGKKNFKWLCYILDRRDGKVKPHFMPHKIYKAIEAFQTNPDYAFEDVPMPYDLTVHAENAGTMEVKYTVIPARKETALTDSERAEIAKAKPLAEIKAALKEKQARTQGGAPPPPPPDADYDDSEIPPFMR